MASIYDHFERRRRELRRYSSGALTDSEIDAMFSIAEDGRGAIIAGRIVFDDRTFVAIFERLEADDQGRIEIVEYSYWLIVEGQSLLGYDLDASHDPPAHRHRADGTREATSRVSLREAFEDFWDQTSRSA